MLFPLTPPKRLLTLPFPFSHLSTRSGLGGGIEVDYRHNNDDKFQLDAKDRMLDLFQAPTSCLRFAQT